MGIYDIPCKHETGEVSSGITVADYHPLTTKKELNRLLEAAYAGDIYVRASVQVRLSQAIPDMVCPRPIEGYAASKLVKLGQLFVAACKSHDHSFERHLLPDEIENLTGPLPY